MKPIPASRLSNPQTLAGAGAKRSSPFTNNDNVLPDAPAWAGAVHATVLKHQYTNTRGNTLLGILHSPSFHQSFSDGLHFRDPDFGGVVLAVCSLANRYSDDPSTWSTAAAGNGSGRCGPSMLPFRRNRLCTNCGSFPSRYIFPGGPLQKNPGS
ncbi:hypothetical protein C8R44DRAFT_352063 [Mycena epipterygia]|nr:hypothetical protein C8R44DRAFT_352063 [Mycena epipterygia]